MVCLDNAYQSLITHFLDNAEGINVVMPMYNLLVTISLWHQEVCGIIIKMK